MNVTTSQTLPFLWWVCTNHSTNYSYTTVTTTSCILSLYACSTYVCFLVHCAGYQCMNCWMCTQQDPGSIQYCRFHYLNDRTDTHHHNSGWIQVSTFRLDSPASCIDLSVYTYTETGEETVHVSRMYSFHFMKETSSAWCQQVSCTAMYCHVWYAAFLLGGNRSNRDSGRLYHHVTVHPVLHPSFCGWMGAEVVLMFQKLIVVFGRITVK